MKKKDFMFFVDQKKLVTEEQFLTGKKIKELANIPSDKELFLVVPAFQDELIDDEKVVNFARPGVERFITRPKGCQEIIVNGQLKHYPQEMISYDDVVKIAFPKVIGNGEVGFTVTYSDGPEQNVEGIMVRGKSVFVKHLMKFNVTATHKS